MKDDRLQIEKSQKNTTLYLSLSLFSMQIILILSFFAQYIYLFSATAYVAILAVALLLFLISKPMIFESNLFSAMWILGIFFVLVSFIRSNRSYGSRMDIFSLVFCILMMLFYSRQQNLYKKCLNFIIAMSCFFAFGVLSQRFIPSLYNFLLRFFPSELSEAFLTTKKAVAEGGGIRGFATNTAIAAGNISAGILACVANLRLKKRFRKRDLCIPGILLLAAFYTGKRGPVTFLILSMLLCSFLPTKGSQKMKKWWYVLLAVCFIFVLFALFGDTLISIPFIREIVETINGLVIGEDVSSLRLALYAWAIQLFLQNPVFGIGWGMFRTTVAGNVSYDTALDAHNIYLQLLCETGIFGFLCIVGILIAFWLRSKKIFVQIMNEKSESSTVWRGPMFFSFAYQTYFLLYGLTGNPLYDQNTQILYFFACQIMLACYCVRRKQKDTLINRANGVTT